VQSSNADCAPWDPAKPIAPASHWQNGLPNQLTDRSGAGHCDQRCLGEETSAPDSEKTMRPTLQWPVITHGHENKDAPISSPVQDTAYKFACILGGSSSSILSDLGFGTHNTRYQPGSRNFRLEWQRPGRPERNRPPSFRQLRRFHTSDRIRFSVQQHTGAPSTLVQRCGQLPWGREQQGSVPMAGARIDQSGYLP